MISKILVAHDGSESADKAFAMALELAAKFSAQLYAASVVHLPELGEYIDTEAMIRAGRDQYDKLGERLAAQATAAGQAVRFDVLVGHPAEQLLSQAEKLGIDLVVLGHRGKSLFERWLTGSTTKQVMGYAHCPVLVVR
ncbi:MAG: universal stress protein [Nevskia sp.]|nr:universal stress protein [Nevskia sp.]